MDFAYSALEQWSSITRNASLDTSELVATICYRYDLANWLSAITHQDNTPATFAGYDYTYDNAGQLTDADHSTQTDDSGELTCQ